MSLCLNEILSTRGASTTRPISIHMAADGTRRIVATVGHEEESPTALVERKRFVGYGTFRETTVVFRVLNKEAVLTQSASASARCGFLTVGGRRHPLTQSFRRQRCYAENGTGNSGRCGAAKDLRSRSTSTASNPRALFNVSNRHQMTAGRCQKSN